MPRAFIPIRGIPHELTWEHNACLNQELLNEHLAVVYE